MTGKIFYTSPIDEVDELTDFKFELPEIGDSVVFVVDNDRTSGALHAGILESVGYRVRQFPTPQEALEELRRQPPSIIVTDFAMDGMSGLELAQAAQEHDPDIRIIMLTGSGDESTAQAALRMGISDYIKKPPNPESLKRSVQRVVHARAADQHHRAMVAWMREELDRRAEAIRQVTVSTLASLANALDMRSPHFQGHSRAVAMQAAAIAQVLGADEHEVEMVRTAGLLHDVGMMAVPDALVQKPESLTPEEYEVIRSHCDRGVEILEPMKHLGRCIRYVHEHHERWDGSGYPRGLRGDEISLGGQIVGISEAWIAILESRAYRSGRSREEGLAILDAKRGIWFSDAVTDALFKADVGMI
ncbi:MAG TPA: HD domain-containing phosphohydrolase [Longimicrobiales bacterium]|nr:HD domain-containing phosphohydrolase [Longimicrobiales bacterium]